ncbi:Hsp20/alpha crystallin family protein [Noviherbaspirillum pedocola]|uniref:Hsp20/alpha crystallin family protein n=1 Tax=Noviherbaspirillum pedocola TaxID=2801341 RepID=A0A934SVZ9_9BURK|nr:Hsp20/alpha crystallin family protein [Noviherbaspirillum pedocola]MBK4737595.1 Hsp20/alpha crystallin family protein [Noviherbaspirillum pedocola]
MASNMTRFNPLSEIARMEPFRSVEDLFREFSLIPAFRHMQAEPRIRTEITETDQAYLVKAEIPGVKKEDIKISVEGNRVSVNAEVKEEKEEKSTGTVYSERYYGQQSRSFTLPQEVDDAKAEAKYENGLLMLTLPKKAGTGAKQLSVQ